MSLFEGIRSEAFQLDTGQGPVETVSVDDRALIDGLEKGRHTVLIQGRAGRVEDQFSVDVRHRLDVR